ncbi:MAG: DDE-type integrase/transposase/recombinase, partial [Candidatus Pacearchaeota archaeon]|nr:DDE-type integrase/transposase/recombinase [Candidatus Pacearchaeota archaeon]
MGYGCARIKQRLFCAPEIELSKMEIFVQGLTISRTTVNNFLKKHKLNGYCKKKNQKAWKFFRAKCPNELWQLDMKEFKFEGKKYYFIVCIDDYSRNLLCLKLLDHSPNIPEICQAISSLIEKYHPQKILTDNNPFKENWKNWCSENKIEAVFAHPYYPQDKGKVERT